MDGFKRVVSLPGDVVALACSTSFDVVQTVVKKSRPGLIVTVNSLYHTVSAGVSGVMDQSVDCLSVV